MGNGWGGVKRCQNIPRLTNMFRIYAVRIVQFKKPFQSLVADCPYHPDTGMRHVAHVKNNVSRLDVFPFAAGKREASAERWPGLTKRRGHAHRSAVTPMPTHPRETGYHHIWAQPLGPANKPSGAAFAVYHFDSAPRSPTLLPFDEKDLFVGSNQILVSLSEMTGNIWSTRVSD